MKRMKPNDRVLKDFAQANHVPDFERLHEFPKFVQIETVSSCNARCVMCPVEDWKRDVNLMPDELFSKIVKELIPHKDWITKVTLQLDGEPLLDKKIEARIKAIKKIGIRRVCFSSNASLMTAKRAESIIKSGIDEISFSIDGATAETFDKIRVRLKYEECVSNIETFIRLRDKLKSPLQIRLRMTIQDQNAHEFEAFSEFWSKRLSKTDRVYGKLIHNWANWLESYTLPTRGQRPDILNDTACISPWGTLIILTDGRVALCCSDYNAKVELGNVNQATMQAIWQSRPFRDIRQSHRKEGRKCMSICKDCNIWDPLSTIELKRTLS